MRTGTSKGWPWGTPGKGSSLVCTRCWAVLAEVRVVAQLWLRPGNAPCGSNAAAFFLDLRHNLPGHLRLRGVRADAGFCLPEWLALWEELRLPYVVVAQLSQPIQRLLRGDLQWATTEVAELEYQAMHWPHPGGKTTVKLAVPERERGWWRRLWEKILSPWPNCNAVENRPVFSG